MCIVAPTPADPVLHERGGFNSGQHAQPVCERLEKLDRFLVGMHGLRRGYAKDEQARSLKAEVGHLQVPQGTRE